MKEKKSFKNTILAGAMTFMVIGTPRTEISAAMAMVESQTYKEWTSSEIYTNGDRVVYDKKVYEAKWWTQGDKPDKKVKNEWDSPWKYLCDSFGDGIISEENEVDEAYSFGEGIEWEDHIFAPYVDATSWPQVNISEVYEKTGCKFFNLGFIVSKDKKASWGTYYDAEECPLNEEIKKLRDLGGDVIVSFGGANNTPLHVDIEYVTELKNEYKRVIDKYGLTKIDIDIEGEALVNKEANERNSEALLMLQEEMENENKKLDIGITLPITPKGLTCDGIYILENMVERGVNIKEINAMTMDFAEDNLSNTQGKMGQYSIEAITRMHEQLKDILKKYNIDKSDKEVWNMIGVTPMIGVNDVKSEIFKQDDAIKLIEFAMKNKIGYVGFWSINRDHNGEYGVCSDKHTGIESEEYEFTKKMKDFMKINNID